MWENTTQKLKTSWTWYSPHRTYWWSATRACELTPQQVASHKTQKQNSEWVRWKQGEAAIVIDKEKGCYNKGGMDMKTPPAASWFKGRVTSQKMKTPRYKSICINKYLRFQWTMQRIHIGLLSDLGKEINYRFKKKKKQLKCKQAYRGTVMFTIVERFYKHTIYISLFIFQLFIVA